MAGEMLKMALMREKMAMTGKKKAPKKGITLQMPMKAC